MTSHDSQPTTGEEVASERQSRDDQRPTPRLRISRRAVLGASALAVTGLAGCLGGNGDNEGGDGNESDNGTETSTSEETDGNNGTAAGSGPLVADPPDVVYTPTHRAPVEMVGTVEAGEYTLVPHFSLPHWFWLTRSDEVDEVAPRIDDSVHLMLAFWDGETGQSVPVDIGATIELRKDGQRVTQVAPWAMLSQRMGFHLGDNVELPEDGTYTAGVTIPPVDGSQIRKTGAFAGRFEETETATFEFAYSTDLEQQLADSVDFVEKSRWGEPGAIEPMQMGNRPSPSLPAASEYPGRQLLTPDGEVPTSDDTAFVVSYLPESRLTPGDEGYLLVSPRTPHNRIPVPEMALSVAAGDSEGVELTQTLDGELGLHYGTPLTLEAGERVDIAVESPPQVARHQGYETAMLAMDSVSVQTPEVDEL